jgi:aurora kinase
MYGWFHDDNRIYIILEYACFGELYKKLKKVGRFDEKAAATVIKILNLIKNLIICFQTDCYSVLKRVH